MPSYPVQTVVARRAYGERHPLERQPRSAAEATTLEGTGAGFERSIHVPEDETCFFAFAAPSVGEAALVSKRAGLQPMRGVEAIPSERNEQ